MENLILLAIAQAQESEGQRVPAEPLDPAQQPRTQVAPTNGVQPQAPRETPGFGWQQIMLFAALAAVMYFMFIRGPRKQQQQQKQMIQTLKKNDRVRTIGGIMGTIVDVRDDYITLKIDESNNTKIRVVPGAISKNLAPDVNE